MADKWLFTDEELKRSPSRLAGMSKDEEMANRVNAASLIQDIGDKLTINQLSTNTGIVYMHRFYMKCSFQKFNYTTMSAACLFLAAKVEDQPRKLEYVAKVLNNYNAKQRHSEANHPPPNSAQEVRDLVEEIAFDEEILLQVLGLQTTVDHPHSQIVNSCAMLKASKEISHSSYVCASTSLVVTTMCLRFPSTVIACVCINIALRWGGFEIKKTSEGKLWYNYVDPTMTLEKLEALSNELASAIEKYPKNLLKRKGIGAKIAGLGPVFSNHPSKNHHHHHKQPHMLSSHPSQKLPSNVRLPNHPPSHHRPPNQLNGNSAAKTFSVTSTTSTITTTTSTATTTSDTTTTATTTTTTPVVNKTPKLINMQEYKERKQKELKEQQLKIQQQQKEQEIKQEQLKAQQQLKQQQEQEQLKIQQQQQEQLKIQQQQQQLKMQQQLKLQQQQKEQQLKAQQHKEQQLKLQKEQMQRHQQQKELLKQQQNQLIKQQLSKQPLPQQQKDKPRPPMQQLQRPQTQQKWPHTPSQHTTTTSTTKHSLPLNTSLPNLPSLPVQLPIPTSIENIPHTPTTSTHPPRPLHPNNAVTATTTITTSKTFNPIEANVKKHKALSTLLQAEAAKNQQKKLNESAASKAAVSSHNSSINSGSLNRSMVGNPPKTTEVTPRSSNILVNSNNISEIIKSVSSQPFSHHQSSHSDHHHSDHHHHTSSHHHQSSNHYHHRDSEHRHSKKHHKEKKKHHHKHHKSKDESKRKHHEDSSLPPIKFKLSNPPVSPPPIESSDLKLKIKDLPNYVVSKDNQAASLSSSQPSLDKEPIKLKISKDKGGHYINPNQSAKALIEAKKRKLPMDQNGMNIKMPRTDNDLYPPSF